MLSQIGPGGVSCRVSEGRVAERVATVREGLQTTTEDGARLTRASDARPEHPCWEPRLQVQGLP